MNPWRDEWKNGADEWTVGEGKAAVLCGISLAPPSLFCSSFLLIGWEESMLLEGTAVMWGLLPSLSQPLQFMNESWKNWMKNWVACERVVCALPVLCSSGKICLALVLWMHFLCMLYTHNHGRHLTLNQGGARKKSTKKRRFFWDVAYASKQYATLQRIVSIQRSE